MYAAVKSAAQGAIDMAGRGASVYHDYVDSGARPDDRYMGQARQLLGGDDQATVKIAFRK